MYVITYVYIYVCVFNYVYIINEIMYIITHICVYINALILYYKEEVESFKRCCLSVCSALNE